MPTSSTSALRSLWCIVLAAGSSSRLGQPKQLVRFGASTLLSRTLRIAGSSVGVRIVVVVGAQALRIRSHLRAQFPMLTVVCNGRWQEGQSGSLARGLASLPSSCRGALILVSDQPLVDARDLGRLALAWSRRPGVPAAAAYSGRVGVPAILPRHHFAAARRLKGDVGARTLLRSEPALTTVAIESAAFDLDTPADLERLNRSDQDRRL